MESLGKIDVVMCTWNSNKPWFKIVLHSIRREIPICHFIVVDRFSNDGTQRVVKEIFPEAIIIESNLNLGRARAEAVKHVDTEWFVFVDDDIELFNGWFKAISKYLNPAVGAIAFIALPEVEWLKKLSYSSRRIAESLGRKWILERGIYCTNTLVRTRLVKDWLPPSFISSGEDAHLSSHIISKGYNTIVLRDHYVIHHGVLGLKSTKKKLWHYSGMRLVRYTPTITTRKLIRRLLISQLRGLYISIKLKEAMVIPYIILSDFYSLKGWLQWNKYLVWKR
jgi:glycosyltransferase involved in cell wall biosynthesis